MHLFMCTMAAGLEGIAAEELSTCFPKITMKDIKRGKVFFESGESLEHLRRLRCVDNIYLVLGTMHIGTHKNDLVCLDQAAAQIDLRRAITFTALQETPRILVSASKKGKHTYSRFDLSARFSQILVQKYHYIEGGSQNFNLAIRLDLENGECMVSAQLTEAAFRFRGNCYTFQAGGIRPTVAAALIWISRPASEDVFYDPFCGSGTIPRERAFYKARRIIASDINAEIVASTRNNLPSQIKLFCCDAQKLRAADHSIDVIVSNIPWGKQIPVDNILNLYTSFLREAKRVLSEKGRMVLLTDHEEIVQAAAENQMNIQRITTVSLHGLLAGVYYIS